MNDREDEYPFPVTGYRLVFGECMVVIQDNISLFWFPLFIVKGGIARCTALQLFKDGQIVKRIHGTR